MLLCSWLHLKPVMICVQTFMNTISFRLGRRTDTTELQLDSSLWPWPWFRVTGEWDSNNFNANDLKEFENQFRVTLVSFWVILVWWLSSSCPAWSVFKGENPTQEILCLMLTLACIQSFADIFLGVMVDCTELCIFIPVWIIWTFIQGHSCLRKQTLVCSFSCKVLDQFGWNIEFCYDPLVC